MTILPPAVFRRATQPWLKCLLTLLHFLTCFIHCSTPCLSALALVIRYFTCFSALLHRGTSAYTVERASPLVLLTSRMGPQEDREPTRVTYRLSRSLPLTQCAIPLFTVRVSPARNPWSSYPWYPTHIIFPLLYRPHRLTRDRAPLSLSWSSTYIYPSPFSVILNVCPIRWQEAMALIIPWEPLQKQRFAVTSIVRPLLPVLHPLEWNRDTVVLDML